MQILPCIRSIAESIFSDGFRSNPVIFQILQSGFIRTFQQVLIVEICGFPVDFIAFVTERRSGFFFGIHRREGHTAPLCQNLDGFDIAHVIGEHHELDDITALVTAETVKMWVIIRINRAGRRFLRMKRTTADVNSSAFFHIRISPEHIDNIICRFDLRDEFFRQSCHNITCLTSRIQG